MVATPHERESERLASLASLSILDSAAEPIYDQIVELAAWMCHSPIAGLAFVDDHRSWSKASIGIAVDEMPRETSICANAISSVDTMVVNIAVAALLFGVAGSLALLTGRILHPLGFAATPQKFILRQVGMVLTLGMIAVSALGLLGHAFF